MKTHPKTNVLLKITLIGKNFVVEAFFSHRENQMVKKVVNSNTPQPPQMISPQAVSLETRRAHEQWFSCALLDPDSQPDPPAGGGFNQ